MGLVSFFYIGYAIIPVLLIEKANLPPMHVLGIFVKTQI